MKGICFFFRVVLQLEKREKGGSKMTHTQEPATWGELLHTAVHTPGKQLSAYAAKRLFHFPKDKG
jgi:hypothetical protein